MVSQSLNTLPAGTFALTFYWTANANGSVNVTPATSLPEIAQGMRILQVETVPGSPAPTNGYSISLKNSFGTDLMAGAMSSVSSTVNQLFAGTSASPPFLGLFSLVITGNLVANAQGTVVVYFAASTLINSNAGSVGPQGPPGPVGPAGAASDGYVITTYNFSPQSPGGNLTVGANTITMNPLPAGVSSYSSNFHYLYISGGTGTAEAVPIIGVTGNTVIVTCAFTHTGAWTISSASAGMQEAIEVAEQAGGGIINVPVGTHTCYGTVYVRSSAIHIEGVSGTNNSGITGSVIYRTTDYGDTIQVPSGIYDFSVEDVQFVHYINYQAGPPPTMVNQITVNTSSAHLNIFGTQGCRIQNCGFENMPYNVVLNGGAHYLIKHNFFVGLWDPKNSNCQQSIANLALLYAGGESPTNIDIESNFFLGYNSASRTRTINGVNVTTTENVGPQSMIIASSFENVHISGGIIGGAAFTGISVGNGSSHVQLGLEISDVQFDSEGSQEILFEPLTGNTVGNVTIHGNTFNGEITTGLNGIYAVGTGGFSTLAVSGLSITGNVFLAYAATPIILLSGTDINISGNSIRGYNSVQAYNSDANNGAAIAMIGSVNNFNITGNIIGGGDMGELYGSGAFTVYGITVGTSPSNPAVWTVSDNTVVSINNANDLAYFNAASPLTSGAQYHIASETGSNNAIAGGLNSNITLQSGLIVSVKLAHTLQAGANTFNYNGGGAVNIKSSRNTANNIATAYASGGTINLMYDGTQWVDLSQ